ncbi:conserved hypothetical protein [Trichodesmium erythraeum IMS101]|uniref:Uncharacterized protein n=1 Tax=Trichodesmium erythraeum (strain IMS101) TaxID=203124 RepID=Q110Y4_TRIEI|nr:hypothetical protein [Trichodesmium erythraeum GBRTRLIN201]MDT9340615.1 hypothetical protein [Trichodesmium erythraeum 21-75]
MSYSQFNLETVEQTFGLNILESLELFATIPEVKISDFLKQCLQYNTPIALEIATEKARSEMIITPILIELKKQFESNISLFSGREFNVDSQLGLIGYCDFIISKSPSQLIIKSPVAIILEAKNDNIQSGLGQCIAEMVAAQIFNRRQNKNYTIYGCVTTGTNWKFMKLFDQVVRVDPNEYFLNNIGKLMGILRSFIESEG